MEKWADYAISKATWDQNSRLSTMYIHEDLGSSLSAIGERDRNWVVQKLSAGKSFVTVDRTLDGKWLMKSTVEFKESAISLNFYELPSCCVKRKTFVSYYHNADEAYKKLFCNRFDDLIVNKSVSLGDIDSDNSDEYIKQLIQKDFLSDTTVLVVLVGPKTKCRKHIDWEISAALNRKVGDTYAGLLGLVLPGHVDFGKTSITSGQYPIRLQDNIDSGYAVIQDFPNSRKTFQKFLEQAFSKRSTMADARVNSRTQMQTNSCS